MTKLYNLYEDERLKEICEKLEVTFTPDQIRYIIRKSFPKEPWYRRWYHKYIVSYRRPQAYSLEKVLRILQILLSTQDLDKIIRWAYEDRYED